MTARMFETLERALLAGAPADRVGAHARSLLEEVVSAGGIPRAVRHPLGFLCLPVLREGDRGVCVHLFEEGDAAEPGVDPHHSHSWDLLSHVLYGAVSNLPVEVGDDPVRPTHRVYEVISGPDGTDEIRPTPRRVRRRAGEPVVFSRGQTYTLPAGLFHASGAPRGPAATLVLGRTRPGGRDLSLGPLEGRPRRTVRALCDERETVLGARSALRRMHDEPD
ncbi:MULTISPECIES: hypothetical protein [Streptomyces]|uniref:hypothetical protein n=1 Tax=Streptomyces TaxID=1883 RepID=UPI00140C1A1B|nr:MULTISPECIES: hypothetical protein [Streptomyces]MDH6227023.1 hypothetical protein [Streptomyces sp. MJP52]